jgi:uncharacterized Zn ribbon protein
VRLRMEHIKQKVPGFGGMALKSEFVKKV